MFDREMRAIRLYHCQCNSDGVEDDQNLQVLPLYTFTRNKWSYEKSYGVVILRSNPYLIDSSHYF